MVRLSLIRASDLEPFTWTDSNFRPYHLIQKQPPAETVTKLDLFTQEERTLSKVAYTRTAPRNVKAWELDVDPALSYAYDKHLRFGVVHQFQNDTWTPRTSIDSDQTGHFEKLLSHIQRERPAKVQYSTRILWRYKPAHSPHTPFQTFNVRQE